MKTGILTDLVREALALEGADIGSIEDEPCSCNVIFYLPGMQLRAVQTEKRLTLQIMAASAVVPSGRPLAHGLAILADTLDKVAKANEPEGEAWTDRATYLQHHGLVCGVCEEPENVVWSDDAEMYLCPTCLEEGVRGDNDG